MERDEGHRPANAVERRVHGGAGGHSGHAIHEGDESTWIEALFGHACLVCGAPGLADGLGCDEHRLQIDAHARCRLCAALLPPALAACALCGACRRERARRRGVRIQRAHSVGDYDDPLLRELVLAFKHGGRPGLAPHLGALLHVCSTARARLVAAGTLGDAGTMGDAGIQGEAGIQGDAGAPDEGEPRRGDILVPVPLHPARRLERGYDQARLLADGVAAAAPPGFHAVRSVLRRARATAPQGATGLLSREDNVHGAFAPAWPAAWSRRLVRGRRVWLVDDVWTSGATLRACAAGRHDMGAAWCGALVVARASRSRGATSGAEHDHGDGASDESQPPGASTRPAAPGIERVRFSSHA
ncbi:MAG: ComF family protein [Planctomycetia bacterium]